jgi:6-pyruvoyl tetrahydropterin synthase/QueD family protein
VRALAGTVFITRQVHFNSAHRLYNPTKSLAWNQKQYGLCTNPHWHGHNYVLEVTVKGQPDPVTGYIIDLARLKKILHRAVVDKCDHRNLNDEVDFLRGIILARDRLAHSAARQAALREALRDAAQLRRVLRPGPPLMFRAVTSPACTNQKRIP